MVATVVADVGLLGWFKYYGFFSVNVANGLHDLGLRSPLPLLQVALPVGISFFTFMGISYVVDCYRGKIEPAGWLDAAVYLAFFPHLVAGPIVRGSELLPQLRERARPAARDRRQPRAAWLIMAGLAKKVVISSFLARVHRRSGVRPARPALGPRGARRASTATPSRSTPTSAATPTSRSASRCCSGSEFPENFNAPYAADVDAGLLAPVAHDAVALAARLRLHPARRQPRPDGGGRPLNIDAHHAHRRSVARRGVDVRGVGRVPRRRRRSAGHVPRAGPRRSRSRARGGRRSGSAGSRPRWWSQS